MPIPYDGADHLRLPLMPVKKTRIFSLCILTEHIRPEKKSRHSPHNVMGFNSLGRFFTRIVHFRVKKVENGSSLKTSLSCIYDYLLCSEGRALPLCSNKHLVKSRKIKSHGQRKQFVSHVCSSYSVIFPRAQGQIARRLGGVCYFGIKFK